MLLQIANVVFVALPVDPQVLVLPAQVSSMEVDSRRFKFLLIRGQLAENGIRLSVLLKPDDEAVQNAQKVIQLVGFSIEHVFCNYIPEKWLEILIGLTIAVFQRVVHVAGDEEVQRLLLSLEWLWIVLQLGQQLHKIAHLRHVSLDRVYALGTPPTQAFLTYP